VKILAFMQNQWFRDPDKVRSMLEREQDPVRRERLRRSLIKYALFAGCKSGRVLRKHFGDLCDEIHWEEASPQIGGRASDAFPPDLVHMAAVIAGLKPDLIITFGKVAAEGLAQLGEITAAIVAAPHPAARHPTAGAELTAAAVRLRLKLEAVV
jgi:hypothetical protein